MLTERIATWVFYQERLKLQSEQDPIPYEPLPKQLKIHEMIYHLLVLDLDIGNDSVPWSFTDASKMFEWHTMIQKHELFPYFLYKAVKAPLGKLITCC